MAHRASDDASICLAIHMFCQFTSSDVKAIPAAFIETTYSITVTAKEIKQKRTPPSHLRRQNALTPQETARQRQEGSTYKSKLPFWSVTLRLLKWLNYRIIYLSLFKAAQRGVEVLLCKWSWLFFRDPLQCRVLWYLGGKEGGQWAVHSRVLSPKPRQWI